MNLDIAFPQPDWIPDLAGEALIQNNKPLLAYIAVKATAFTSKDHNFLAGTKFEKQLTTKNNSRKADSYECSWSFNLPKTASSIPFIDHITTPLVAGKPEKRWLDGLYVDVPEEWDDPYRFFRW